MSVDEMNSLITKCKRNLGGLIEMQKILENSKKFLTNDFEFGIIHTVRNETSNKVSKFLEKGFKKEI